MTGPSATAGNDQPLARVRGGVPEADPAMSDAGLRSRTIRTRPLARL